ncbi:MAG: metal-dependent hydrolase [Sandaracinaceae bacterium]
MPAGHLATAYLVARRNPRETTRRFVPLALGVLLPDLVDKSLMLSGWTPYGRTVGHSAVLWVGLAGLLVGAATFTRRSLMWPALVLLGGLLHVLVDPVDDVAEGITFGGYLFSAWVGWPITNPDMLSVRVPAVSGPTRFLSTGLEVATVLSTVLLVVWDGRRRP